MRRAAVAGAVVTGMLVLRIALIEISEADMLQSLPALPSSAMPECTKNDSRFTYYYTPHLS